jgi:hypothetical protein
LMANDILYVPMKSGSSTKWKRAGKVTLTVLPATMGVLFLILSRI